MAIRANQVLAATNHAEAESESDKEINFGKQDLQTPARDSRVGCHGLSAGELQPVPVILVARKRPRSTFALHAADMPGFSIATA